MEKTNIKKILSLLLCFVLFVAIALFVTGCSDKKDVVVVEPKTETVENTEKPIEEGVSFKFAVTHKDGSEKEFDISTDKKTVGEALLEEGLIAGEDSQYGLYVLTVDGETVNYDEDGYYWSFLINGEYAMSGVDSTEIVEGSTYSLVASK